MPETIDISNIADEDLPAKLAIAQPGPGRTLWARFSEKCLVSLIWLCGISAIVFVLAIFFFVFREAVPVLFAQDFNLFEFLFSGKWYPTSEVNVRYGTLFLIAGSFAVTTLAMVIAVPFGLGAAIYISEFCNPKLRETLKIIIELLAAIPSVVWGPRSAACWQSAT